MYSDQGAPNSVYTPGRWTSFHSFQDLPKQMPGAPSRFIFGRCPLSVCCKSVGSPPHQLPFLPASCLKFASGARSRGHHTEYRGIMELETVCFVANHITQTAGRCRVPGGVCYGWAMGVAGVFRLGARARTVCFTVLRASDLRHSAVEWSVATV